jgi:hypothetical protein
VNLFIVQAKTLSQIFLSTGKLSQVSIDSSIHAFQEIIFPSTGILSHGLTKIISQILIFSISVSINSFQFLTKAVFGARDISLAIASLVFDFALVSRYFPKQTKVIKSAETSK